MQALGFVWKNAPRRQFNLVHCEEVICHASHDGAVALLEAWDGARARGGMVVGRDFPARAFARMLSDAILFERNRGAYRVRLAGFAMLCFHGFDITGKPLSAFLSEDESKFHRRCLGGVLRSREPGIMQAQARCGGATVLRREIVMLPVLASDLTTPLVLTVSFWNDRHWLN